MDSEAGRNERLTLSVCVSVCAHVQVRVWEGVSMRVQSAELQLCCALRQKWVEVWTHSQVLPLSHPNTLTQATSAPLIRTTCWGGGGGACGGCETAVSIGGYISGPVDQSLYSDLSRRIVVKNNWSLHLTSGAMGTTVHTPAWSCTEAALWEP